MRLLIFLFGILQSINCFGQTYLSKQEAEEDIDHLNKTLLEVHIDPFFFISRENYFSAVQELKASIKDSIELKAFVLELYKLTALLKDGHCSPSISQPAFRDSLRKEIFFPYHLVIDNGELFVPQTTAGDMNIPVGATIVSINGQETGDLLRKFQHTIGGSAAFSNEIEEKFLSYFLYLCDVTAPFTIRYKDIQGQIFQKRVENAQNFVNALAVTMPHIKTKYRFEIIEDKLGDLDFMNMSGDLNAFDKYLDSCFTLLKSRGIKYLAIDLRKNSGGNSLMGEVLLSYFNKKNYTLMGGRRWKISEGYKHYLLANGDSTNQYLQKQTGSIWELGNCKAQHPRFKKKNVFTGKVYVLTGPFTFSSANMLADGVKQFKLAEIVGEPTGEDTNDFGEAYSFTLPRSKIKIQTSTSFDFGAACDKKTQTPVVPDKLVPRTLADRIQEKDRAMEYVLMNAR